MITAPELEKYGAYQNLLLSVRPGITGYWQVNGKNNTTFSRMIALDLLYAKRMSPWLDLMIMAKTIPALVAQVLETRRAKNKASKKDVEVMSSQATQIYEH